MNSALHAVVITAILSLVACSSDPPPTGPMGDESLRRDATGPIEIRRNGPTLTIRGGLPAVEASEAGARELVERHPEVFGLGPDDAVQEIDRLELGDGFYVVRLLRSHRGLPIFAGELRFAFSPGGELLFVQAPLTGPLDVPADAPVDPAPARALALGAATPAGRAPAIAHELLGVFVPSLYGLTGSPGLAYRFEVGLADQTTHVIFVDPAAGSVALEFSSRRAALDRTVHAWQGDADWIPDFGAPVLVREGDPPPDAGAPPLELEAYEAYLQLGATYDYLVTRFGWDGWDGRGSGYVIFVGYPEDNAGWYGSYAAFGSGNTTGDVVTHELGHGVVDAAVIRPYGSTADGFVACGESLENWILDAPVACGESEALDEWVGDALAVFASFHAGMGDWRIETTSEVIRDLSQAAAHRTITDYGAVASDPKNGHRNSAIPSLATYLLADPSAVHPRSPAPPPVRSIGVEKVEEIFFRALRLYLRSTATFDDTRYAWLRACEDLVALDRVGMEIRDCGAVLNAWAAVGVGPRDTDEDTWHDEVDNCPDDFNPTQDDADGDHEGDVCDRPDVSGAGNIEGTVTDAADGSALAGISVHLLPTDLSLAVSTRTDSLGGYAFRDLPPDTYGIGAEGIGYAREDRDVDVVAGGTARADFALRSSGTTPLPREFACPATFATTGGYGVWPFVPGESGEVVCGVPGSCGTGVRWECAYGVPAEWMSTLTGFIARLRYVNESTVVPPCPPGGEFEAAGYLQSGTHEASVSVPFTSSDPLGMPGFAAGGLAFRDQLLRQLEATNAIECQ